MTPDIKRNLFFAALYFGLSTLFTWWFVAVSPLYISEQQMIMSTAVAGGKWGIQILLALLLLKKQAWTFIKNIGFVCLVGSCILLPYVILSLLNLANDGRFFVGSLAVSVITMIFCYRRATKLSGVNPGWWYFWLGCLGVAISLQLTIVFHVITF